MKKKNEPTSHFNAFLGYPVAKEQIPSDSSYLGELSFYQDKYLGKPVSIPIEFEEIETLAENIASLLRLLLSTSIAPEELQLIPIHE